MHSEITRSTVLGLFNSEPWAILPGALTALMDAARRYSAGESLVIADTQAVARQAAPAVGGEIGLLRLHGTIYPRGGGPLFELFGLSSAEQFAGQFRAAVNDSRIGAIVIDVNSPGGAVSGVDELSRLIYDARGTKPVVAVANHLMASAAYWIGTAADELVMTPSAEVGSVGVFAAHQDISQMAERDGVKVTLVSAGKFKTEANPYEPLTEEARASIQSRVDDYYEMFVKAVARNRGVSVADVRGGFGEGRVVGARQAVAEGMADRIDTLEGTLVRLAKGQNGRTMSASAELDFRQRRARAIG
jgi:capsid assembly protease